MKKNTFHTGSVRMCIPKCGFVVGACGLLLAFLAERGGADPLPTWREENGDAAAHQSEFLRPVSVVSTTGNVTNADALVADHQGYTTLTMVQGETPMVILDYGQDASSG